MVSCYAAAYGVVGVVVLRDKVGRGRVKNLEQLVVGVVSPRGGEAVRVCKRGFQIAAVEVVPRERVGILSWSWRVVVRNFH